MNHNYKQFVKLAADKPLNQNMQAVYDAWKVGPRPSHDHIQKMLNQDMKCTFEEMRMRNPCKEIKLKIRGEEMETRYNRAVRHVDEVMKMNDDLRDGEVIYEIDPAPTPFIAMVGKEYSDEISERMMKVGPGPVLVVKDPPSSDHIFEVGDVVYTILDHNLDVDLTICFLKADMGVSFFNPQQIIKIEKYGYGSDIIKLSNDFWYRSEWLDFVSGSDRLQREREFGLSSLIIEETKELSPEAPKKSPSELPNLFHLLITLYQDRPD